MNLRNRCISSDWADLGCRNSDPRGRRDGLQDVVLIPVATTTLVIIGGFCCILAWGLSGAIVLSGSDRAMFGT